MTATATALLTARRAELLVAAQRARHALTSPGAGVVEDTEATARNTTALAEAEAALADVNAALAELGQ